MSGTIVALGGGGFSMEPELPLFDDHILAPGWAPAASSLLRAHRQR